jgi:uncharacterized protein YkwD
MIFLVSTLIMKHLLHTTIVLLTIVISVSLLGTIPSAARGNNRDLSETILSLINKHRRQMGLQPLQMTPMISAEAEAHSASMAAHRIPLGHSGFDKRMGRIMKQLPHSSAAAENVAYGASSAKEVVNMWLHSRGHRRNIEGNYNLTGIGIARSRNGDLYFTQIFIYQRN